MFPRYLLIGALLLAPSLPKLASTDIVHFGRNLVLPPGQSIHDASCILCSAFLDGRASGSVLVFAGNVALDGAVAGKVVVFGGNVSLTRNAQVGEQVIIVGGRLRSDGTSSPAHTVLPPIIFLPLILLVCIMTGSLIKLTRRMVRGPLAFPPLPRL